MKHFSIQKLLFLSLVLFYFSSCEKSTVPDLSNPDSLDCDSIEALGIYYDYKYPIVPGTSEWNRFTDDQKERVLLIPENTLQKMCTHSLVRTCFNYPLLSRCADYEFFSEWWTKIYQSFNGVSRLILRPDAPQKMLKEYLEFDGYPYYTGIDTTEKIAVKTQMIYMELFLAHEDIITKFSNEELILLGNKAKDLWTISNENSWIDYAVSPSYSCYLLARLMYFNKYGPFVMRLNVNDDLYKFVMVGSNSNYYDNSYETVISTFDEYLSYLDN